MVGGEDQADVERNGGQRGGEVTIVPIEYRINDMKGDSYPE